MKSSLYNHNPKAYAFRIRIKLNIHPKLSSSVNKLAQLIRNQTQYTIVDTI